MVGGDKFVKGHPEMGLVPQQINNILGELLCPFYFILGTLFKKKKENWSVITVFHWFVLNISGIVSPTYRLQEGSSLPSKCTQPKTNTFISSLCRMVFKLIQGHNTRRPGNYYGTQWNIHTYPCNFTLQAGHTFSSSLSPTPIPYIGAWHVRARTWQVSVLVKIT